MTADGPDRNRVFSGRHPQEGVPGGGWSQGNGLNAVSFSLPKVPAMPLEAIHAALGLAFTAVWLLAAQIVVDG